jgi:mevalonate kinase
MPVDQLTNKEYPSKLLLFGEYGVLYGSKALAIPFEKFSGRLVIDDALPKDSSLFKFSEYLKGIESELKIPFDVDGFKHDIEKGLKYISTIPQNYGLGSSGALTAAVFDNFREVKSDIDSLSMEDLKSDLAKIESFFHGKSSGIDPLVSLLQKPVFIESGSSNTVVIPSFSEHNSGFFLVDSKVQGKTSELVSGFFNKMKEQKFSDAFKSSYSLYSDEALISLLTNDWEKFHHCMSNLSGYQLKAMADLIPEHILEYFEVGLESGKYALKICGSGGGGFFLGYSKDKEFIKQVFQLPVYLL